MEDYPEELTTPPVALVALVGAPELHPLISAYLHSEQPPINTLALPDFSKVGVISGKERRPVDARLPPPVGILKIDWLWKHRTRVPAVLVVLLNREQVYGDPAHWLQVCTNLDNARNAIRVRNTRLVVVLVQPTLSIGDINDDRLVALRKRAEVDGKCFLTLTNEDSSEQKRSLARLGSVLGEMTNAFYREEGKRVKLRLEKKTFSSIELGVRYNFKVAVYAEFRRDWVDALKSYETAYTLLQEMIATPIELQLVQRLVEVKAVAEQLHFKISTLLLHGGKETEAVKWFRQYIAFYRCLIGPPESNFIHWAWVSKQYHVFAELLESSASKTSPLPLSGSAALPELVVTEQELQPGYYYQVAAAYMIKRRCSFEAVSMMFESASAGDLLADHPEKVGPPLYVGQAPRLLGCGSPFDVQNPTEKEYMHHVITQERMFPHSHASINLLMKAYEHHKLRQAGRMVYHVGSEMGREYYCAKDYVNAKRLFDSVAGMYRQEAWVALLWASLGYMRECARQLQLLKEYVEYTLEMATLPPLLDSNECQHSVFGREFGPAGPLSHSQRELLFQEVMKLLQGKQSVLPARDGEHGLAVTQLEPVFLEIDIVSPLRAVLSACVAFHEQTVKPGRPALLTLSLLTHLPQTLEIGELEVQFNQSACNFVLQSSRQDDVFSVDAQTAKDHGLEIKACLDLDLQPNKWKRFSIDATAGLSGKLECLTVIARVGRHSSICCQVESPASREEVSLWKFEPQIEMSPMKDCGLSFFGQKVIQVEEAEALADVMLKASSTGLVGEMFPVSLHVRSKDQAVHAGEMRISITDSSTMPSSSPRETHADSLFVELYCTSSTLPDVDGIQDQKFQKVLGMIKLPTVEPNSNWSTMLYLKWQKPRPVSLFVSFSYQSENVVESSKLHRHFVHRCLQLDCDEAFAMNYQYLAPFRRDTLLLTGLGSTQMGQPSLTSVSIPLNEKSTLLVSAKNCSPLDLKLLSITVNANDGNLCAITSAKSVYGSDHPAAPESHKDFLIGMGVFPGATLMPGETFTQLFSVHPVIASPALEIGTVCLQWERLKSLGASTDMCCNNCIAELKDLPNSQRVVSTYIQLPVVQVEEPPLVVTLDCPPHALLGIPFNLSFKIQNQTPLVQEIRFSVVDSSSFLLSGIHSDTASILPFSMDVLSYKVLPLASGLQQLPQINLTVVRYNAGFHQPVSSSQIFIFPSAPHIKTQMP